MNTEWKQMPVTDLMAEMRRREKNFKRAIEKAVWRGVVSRPRINWGSKRKRRTWRWQALQWRVKKRLRYHPEIVEQLERQIMLARGR